MNLSAFETFFPEKRPFFVEGSNIFEFNVGYDDGSGEQLFYSRRIGRVPQRVPDAPDAWVDAPDVTTILGAVKISGKTASGWTIGFLDAVTAGERARLAGPDGEIGEEPVEPLTNYAVGSVSRDFRRGRSSIGLFGTATNRRLGAGGEFDFLRSSAYVVGVRGRHRFAGGGWEANGYVAASHIRGSEAAISRVQLAPGHYFQRPDAEHLEYDPSRTSLSGAIANVWVGTVGGGRIRGGVGGHLRTPGLELNDVGFMNGADEALVFGSLRYHQFEAWGPFRNFVVALNPSAMWTTGGERSWAQIGHWAEWELHSLWNFGWWVGRRFSALHPTAIRGGPAVRRDDGIQYSAWINGDRRKPVVANVSLSGGREYGNGTWSFSISPGLTFRPSGGISIALSPNVQRNHNTWQYVGQPAAGEETHYIVGELDQTTVSLTTRLGLALSPTLSFELYAQPFLSGGEYTRFRRLAEPRARSFDDRFEVLDASYAAAARRYRADVDGDGAPELTFGNPDFNFKQMRGNAILRWEYTPGSTLYLVWSQSRTASLPIEPGDEPFDLGRDARRLFNRDPGFPTPVTHVFMVKVSYWLNL